MDLNTIIVTIDKKDISLNAEQVKQIREQFTIQDACEVLSCYGFDMDDIDSVDRNTLLEIGKAIEKELANDSGDIEYEVVERFIKDGLLPKLL